MLVTEVCRIWGSPGVSDWIVIFLLYSIDLPIALKNCHTILFADDTTIYTTCTDLLDIFTRINTDLDVLIERSTFKLTK